MSIFIPLASVEHVAAATTQQIASVTLLAHSSQDNQTAPRMILSSREISGSPQSASLADEVIFRLEPVLGRDLSILGTLVIRLHIRSDYAADGVIVTYISERTSKGQTLAATPRFTVSERFDSRIKSLPLIYGLLNYTFKAGSQIQLHVQFLGRDPSATAYLIWDAAVAPTGITLPAVNPLRADFKSLDTEGNEHAIFQIEKEQQTRTVNLSISLSDPFEIRRFTGLKLTVTNSATLKVLLSKDLGETFSGDSIYNAVIEQRIAIERGRHIVLIETADISGNRYSVQSDVWAASFHEFSISLQDDVGRALNGANVRMSTSRFAWEERTNASGIGKFLLPSSEVVGPYVMEVGWRGKTIKLTNLTSLLSGSDVRVQFPASDVTVGLRLFGLPVGGSIRLMKNSTQIVAGSVPSFGTLTLTQIPYGLYDLEATYWGLTYTETLDFREARSVEIHLPLPFQSQLPFVLLFAIIVGSVTVLMRRREVAKPSTFKYFDSLTGGGIPNGSTTLIVGESGSGKTVLTEHLAYSGLAGGRSSIYITNVEFPDRIRTDMESLAMPVDQYEKAGKLVFIDCYTALTGRTSGEKHYVGSLADLTSLGVKVTSVLEELGKGTDVYLDSLTPILSNMKHESVLNFVQSVGAKIRGLGGRFFGTLGRAVDKSALARLEEICDCIIETRLVDDIDNGGKMLRIRKMRGKAFLDRWIPFNIEPRRGIVFYTSRLVSWLKHR